MSRQSKSSQDSDINRAVTDAQESLAESHQYSGGSAMLDAEIQAEQQTSGKPDVEQPTTTNYAGNDKTNDPTEAQQFNTTGAYPSDFQQLEDEGNLSLTKDTPAAE